MNNYKFCLIFVLLIHCLTSCSGKKNHSVTGYIEGKYVYLSSRFPGTLTDLYVMRGAWVQAGAPLFKLDLQPESVDLQIAKQQIAQFEASLQQIDASLIYIKSDLHRKKVIFQKGSLQQSVLDSAEATYNRNMARRQEALAQLSVAKSRYERSQWAISQKTIVAPASGMIFDVYYLPGEIVPAGQAVASLLLPNNIKAIFYIPEPELSNIKLGSAISIEEDGRDEKISGKISYISSQSEYTPPVIYSSETRNKLIYRVEAEFAPDVAPTLHPGQPITVLLNYA